MESVIFSNYLITFRTINDMNNFISASWVFFRLSVSVEQIFVYNVVVVISTLTFLRQPF